MAIASPERKEREAALCNLYIKIIEKLTGVI